MRTRSRTDWIGLNSRIVLFYRGEDQDPFFLRDEDPVYLRDNDPDPDPVPDFTQIK